MVHGIRVERVHGRTVVYIVVLGLVHTLVVDRVVFGRVGSGSGVTLHLQGLAELGQLQLLIPLSQTVPGAEKCSFLKEVFFN